MRTVLLAQLELMAPVGLMQPGQRTDTFGRLTELMGQIGKLRQERAAGRPLSPTLPAQTAMT